jgi:Chitobiase/beta-hexosaminidase C-terminal domain
LADTTAPVVTASPETAQLTSGATVTLSATDDSGGAVTIHYTTDGTTPTTASPVYSTPITITATTTLKYFGVDPTGNQSIVQTQTYTVLIQDTTPPTITINPSGGTYTASQIVTLTADENAVIYYTYDGTTPTTSSPVYSGPFKVSDTMTIKYFGVDRAGNESVVQSATYTINLPAPIAPVFSKVNGYLNTAQQISIGGNSKGGVISGYDSPTIAAMQNMYVRFLFKGTLPNYVCLAKASGNQQFTNITVNPITDSDWQEAVGSLVSNNTALETVGLLIGHDNTGVLDPVTILIDEAFLSNFDFHATTEHVEYIPLGKFFITQWKNDYTSKVITFTANDYFKLFSDTNYPPSTITNLHDLAADVLTKGGVPTEDQYIDASLSAITVGVFKDNTDCRTAIQNIAIASQTCVYQDRNGNIVIAPFTTIDKASNYLSYPTTQNFLPEPYTGPNTYPEMSTGSGMREIMYESMYDPPQIELEQVITTLIVKVYDTAGNAMPDAVFTNPTVTGTAGASFTIDNPLIISTAMAQKVANWYFAETNFSAIYTLNWRQNPALECTDVLLIEDPFNVGKQSRIIHQEFDYEGYLTGTTQARGGLI